MGKPTSIQLLNFLSRHKLACILVVGILVRLLLMPISAHSFDVYVWYETSSSILSNGPFSLQEFPPLWYHYMMIPVAYVYDWLAGVFPTWAAAVPMSSLPQALNFYPAYNVQFVPGLLFNFIVKIPFLISDVLLAVLLYKIVNSLTSNRSFAEKAALLWFLNPFVIWISAGWGMWDTLPAFFTLAAFYLLLKKKFEFSAVCLSLGVALKMYPLFFLVPIAFYLFKTCSVDERRNVMSRFFGVFSIFSLLVFLPYMDQSINFVSNFLFPLATVIDPVVEPLGFGLTYWSLFLLTRLFNVSINVGCVSFMAVLSVVLVAVILGVVYWRISKFSFNKPAFDLNVALLLSLGGLFLFYRVICEQFFVWLIPMLIILCVSGRIRGGIYWGISILALIYCLTNLPLPFFFLPLSPFIGDSLVGMVYAFWPFESVRITVLAILGCLFSVLLLRILLKVEYGLNFCHICKKYVNVLLRYLHL